LGCNRDAILKEDDSKFSQNVERFYESNTLIKQKGKKNNKTKRDQMLKKK
jgi:hypothetical protein